MRQILIDKNKVSKKLLSAIMQNQSALYNIFVKIYPQSTAGQIEHIKKTFNLSDIEGNHFTMTAPLVTISKLLGLDIVEGVGMVGIPSKIDSKAVEPEVWPKLLPAHKEATTGN